MLQRNLGSIYAGRVGEGTATTEENRINQAGMGGVGDVLQYNFAQSRSRMMWPLLTFAPRQRCDGAHRIFTTPGRHRVHQAQADIARTKREAPRGVGRAARKVSCILQRTTCEADFRTLCVLSCVWTSSSNGFLYFLVWPLPETAMGTRY